MGRNREEGRLARQATWQGIIAQESLAAEQARATAQENALRVQERLLGTPEQGGFNAPAGLSEYSQQLNFSPGMLDFYARTTGTSEDFFGQFNSAGVNWSVQEALTDEQRAGLAGLEPYTAYATAISQAATNKMAEARAAFLEGRTEDANRLREEAQGMVGRFWAPAGGGESSRMFTWGAGESYADDLAREQLSSPSARTAGNLVRDAVGLSQPGSPQQEAMYRRLTSDADAAITAGERRASRGLVEERRVAEREARMAGGGFGYRNLGSERALSAAVGRDSARDQADIVDTAAQARAQVFSEARAFIEENARTFAMSQTEWAQKWVQNQAGFRDSFNERMTQLSLATAEVSGRIADRAAQMWTSWATAREQRQSSGSGLASGAMGLLGSILGVAGGFALSGLGGKDEPTKTAAEG